MYIYIYIHTAYVRAHVCLVGAAAPGPRHGAPGAHSAAGSGRCEGQVEGGMPLQARYITSDLWMSHHVPLLVPSTL
jgi:hypothetical protein